MISAVGVALPAVGREFGIGPGRLGLIETSFLAAVVLVLLPAGRLADSLGLERVFRWGTALFALVSLGIGFAPDERVLIALRVLQGVAAGLQNATGVAILSAHFPPEERGRVIGISVGGVYIGLSLGPFAGGYLTDAFGWRTVFLAGGGAGLIAFALVLASLRYRPAGGERFDLRSSLLYALALGLIWFGLERDALYGLPGWGIALVGLALFAYFLHGQWRAPAPLLDVRLLVGNPAFRLGNAVCLINYAASAAVVFTFSLYLQYLRGMSAREAGLVLICQPVIQTIFAPIAGRLSDRFSPGPLVTAGMGLCAIGLVFALNLEATSALVYIYALLSFFGLGFALFSSANIHQIMSSVRPGKFGLASAMVGTMRTVGMLISISLAAYSFRLFIGDEPMRPGLGEPFLRGVHFSFLVFLALSLVGLGISLVLARRERRPENSQRIDSGGGERKS